MYSEAVLERAKATIGPHCKVCKSCDGVACRGKMPGPGGKGLGLGFIRNYADFRRVALEMDTVHAVEAPDTRCTFFGQTLSMPVFAAPIGALQLHYGESYNDSSYSEALVAGCRQAGVIAWTGDGVKAEVFTDNLAAIAAHQGIGIPTIKPWTTADVLEKLRLAEAISVPAVAMDIDAAGLTFLAKQGKAVQPVSSDRLKAIISATELPFIVKGVMTPRAAKAAVEAGAAAILVSNHGGRVLDETPSSLSVLEEIRAAVGPDATIFLDGGVRSGLDVFKAIALGANAVLIGRPFVTAVYGGGAAAVVDYLESLRQDLNGAMLMTGAASIKHIGRHHVRWISGRGVSL